MIISSPWAGILCVAGVLGAALTSAAALRRRGSVGQEMSRKLVHVGVGLVSASFPALFSERWPVWILAVAAVSALSAIRFLPYLRRAVGGSLHDVERDSWGELCFPIAVAFVWSLAPGDWVRFSLPILVLAVADASAALLGKQYGQNAYQTSGAVKTWEGSAVFAFAAFLVVHVPLLLGTETGRAESLLIGLNMALLLMLVESMAWEGFDNLFIPIAGALLITQSLDKNWIQLSVSAAVMGGLALFFWWSRIRTTLDDGAVMAGAILSYIFWNLGGNIWLIGPLSLFGIYAWLYPPTHDRRSDPAIVTLAVALSALVWLLMESRFPGDFRWPIAAAGSWATHLAAIGLFYEAFHKKTQPGWFLIFKSWLIGTGTILLPTALFWGTRGLAAAGAAALGGVLGLSLLWASLSDRREMPMSGRRWLLQALAALAGSIPVLMFQP